MINSTSFPLKHLASIDVRIKILDLIDYSYHSATSVFLKVLKKNQTILFPLMGKLWCSKMHGHLCTHYLRKKQAKISPLHKVSFKVRLFSLKEMITQITQKMLLKLSMFIFILQLGFRYLKLANGFYSPHQMKSWADAWMLEHSHRFKYFPPNKDSLKLKDEVQCRPEYISFQVNWWFLTLI